MNESGLMNKSDFKTKYKAYQVFKPSKSEPAFHIEVKLK